MLLYYLKYGAYFSLWADIVQYNGNRLNHKSSQQILRKIICNKLNCQSSQKYHTEISKNISHKFVRVVY